MIGFSWFQLQGPKTVDKAEAESGAKKAVESTKTADKPEADGKTKKSEEVKTKKSDTVVIVLYNLFIFCESTKLWLGTNISSDFHRSSFKNLIAN